MPEQMTIEERNRKGGYFEVEISKGRKVCYWKEGESFEIRIPSAAATISPGKHCEAIEAIKALRGCLE